LAGGGRSTDSASLSCCNAPPISGGVSVSVAGYGYPGRGCIASASAIASLGNPDRRTRQAVNGNSYSGAVAAHPPPPLLRRAGANGRLRKISAITPNGRSWPVVDQQKRISYLGSRPVAACRALEKRTFVNFAERPDQTYASPTVGADVHAAGGITEVGEDVATFEFREIIAVRALQWWHPG
jgi:hypothetical protein